MKKLVFLVLGMFTVGGSSFMMAGLLPEIGGTLGQPISITGQGITAFSLTYFFSAPVFSLIFAGRSAKRTLQLALIVFLLGNSITLFSASIAPFLIGRVVAGLGAGIFNPLCVSIAVQLGDPSKKGQTLSWIWGANSAGVVFGVPLGVYISSQLNWRFSIGYVLALGLITLVGFSFRNEEINLPGTSSIKDRLRLLVDKKVLSVIGISCFTVLASTGLYSYVSVVHAGAPHSLAATLLVWGAGGFIGSSTVGLFIDRTQSPQGVMVFILAGLTLALTMIPLLIDLPYISLIPFFLWGVFGWATINPQQHVLFDLHENQRTMLSALNSSAISLGSSLGTALGGIIIASGFDGRGLPFWAAAVLAGVLVCQIVLTRSFQRRSVLNELSSRHC